MTPFAENIKKSPLFTLVAIGIIFLQIGLLIFLNCGAAYSPELKTEEERLSFLSALGYSADKDSVQQLEVIIPEDFDEIYLKYAEIQQKSGFRIDKYKGKTVTKYTYRLNNLPENEEAVINLLIYKDRLIAADISSAKLGGYIKPILSKYNSKAKKASV